jgi:hypothetical protein
LRRGPLALEGLHRRGRAGGCLFRCELVLGGTGLQLLELQFQLVQKPGLALRAAAIERAPQLLDLQLQMGDQRIGIAVHRQRSRGFNLRLRGAGFGLQIALTHIQDGRLQGCDIIRQVRFVQHHGVVNHRDSQASTDDVQRAPIPPLPDAMSSAGCASQCRRACSRAVPPRWRPRRRAASAR